MGSPRKDAFVIAGYHAVREALLSGRAALEEIILSGSVESTRYREILSLARDRGVPARRVRDLDSMVTGVAHQGFAAFMKEFQYAELKDIAHGPGTRLLVALDHITDEGNFGAIVRSAAFFGANGIIIPKDRSAAVTPLVFKRSAGGCMHVPIARVVNLERALNDLKGMGLWIIGADGSSPLTIHQFDWNRDLVLVMGNEEKGLGRSVRGRCDELVSIPGGGKVGSLNVSVAAGILLAHIRSRQEVGI